MRPALTGAFAAALLSCGGLENEPLTLGVVRGSLLGATARSTVSVFEHPELTSGVDSLGQFELRGVPQGTVELLALISPTQAERFSVAVAGGRVVDVGQHSGRPVGMIEVELRAPSFQRVDQGTVAIEGTPLSVAPEEPGEWKFRLPAGCYRVRGTVPGLGTATAEGCVDEGRDAEVHLEFKQPNGTPGREGCRVTGCLDALSCHSDGSCGL